MKLLLSPLFGESDELKASIHLSGEGLAFPTYNTKFRKLIFLRN